MSVMIPRIELVVFRYIDKHEAPNFAKRMDDWSVPILGVSTLVGVSNISRTTDITEERKPSAPVSLWDYPTYKEQFNPQPPSSLVTKVAQVENVRLPSLELNNFHITRIEDEPEHYPFTYVLGYHFEVASPEIASNKGILLERLNQWTWEAKTFTEAIFPNAPYRPVYWFLNGMPSELRGLRGIPESVALPSGEGSGKIERGFPHSSYILYDISPSEHEIRFADLGLLSVIAHQTERGHRQKLHDLTQDILEQAGKYDRENASGIALGRDVSEGSSKTIPELRSEIEELSATQSSIRPKVEEFYEIRRRLIRSKGLVQRIRQLYGGQDERTYFDVVCDDAITLIIDEVAMSQEEIATSFAGVSDRLNVVYSQLNNQYSQLNAHRSQRLQQLGYLLQSTAIAYATFQISDTLLPPSWPTAGWRVAIIVAFTAIAAFGTFLILRRLLSERDIERES